MAQRVKVPKTHLWAFFFDWRRNANSKKTSLFEESAKYLSILVTFSNKNRVFLNLLLYLKSCRKLKMTWLEILYRNYIEITVAYKFWFYEYYIRSEVRWPTYLYEQIELLKLKVFEQFFVEFRPFLRFTAVWKWTFL